MNYGRHLISYGGVEGRHVLLRATGEYLSMGNFAVKYRNGIPKNTPTDFCRIR
jgi:hypothetical protein